MAKSRFEYVKKFEMPDPALLNTYMVVRVDGKGFTRFCEVHGLVKPNDVRLLSLMNRAAKHVVNEFKDIMLAYGQSDEYSFLFRKSAQVYNRRCSKILSTVVSLFSSAFIFYWPAYFSPPPTAAGNWVPDEFSVDEDMKFLWPQMKEAVKLAYPPAFDSRLIIYPSQKEIRDYFSWRQADCHINNLYNTCFWKLVLESGISPREANAILGKTDSGAKNEMLFTKYSTNYNNLPALVRKGTTFIRMPSPAKQKHGENSEPKREENGGDEAIRELRGVDIISQPFWDTYPFLVDGRIKASRPVL